MNNRKANSLMHYQCLLCSFVVANRNAHLQNWHEDVIDRFELRKYEGDMPEIEVFYSKYFKETIKKLTSRTSYNYNPGLKQYI